LLDGYHEETHTAYEVHGCFWHGKLVFDFSLNGSKH
jgi:G:T-mismatch repair DNA endonuclease (very short patch repair protein)